MRPVTLTVEGFGTFRERVDIDFAGIELLALVGATGAGKSTVIDAMTFALYGSVARYDDNRNVVNAINQTSTRARVQLEFELADRAYTATRVVQRTANGATTREARLESGESLLASDARTMTGLVEELLGLDVDQFNRTVVLPQGRFAGFLHDRPADRQKALRQLLGFEIYSRIGQAARRRGEDRRIQIGAIRSEISEREGELTDERRADLQGSLDRCVGAVGEVRSLANRREELIREIEPLERRLAELGGDVATLGEIRIPDDAALLDERLETARVAVDVKVSERDVARTAAQMARQAASDGPDLVRCRLLHGKRVEASQLATQVASAQAEAASAEQDLAEQAARASVLDARQAELDEASSAARAREAEARSAVDTLPRRTEIDGWVQRHDRHDRLSQEAAAADEAVLAADAAIEPIELSLAAATEAEQRARDEFEHLSRLAPAAALVGTLVVGEPCPVCRQEVARLPDHDPSADLEGAKRNLDARRADVANARQAFETATERRRQAVTHRDAKRAAADDAAQEISALRTRAEIEALRAAVDSAAETYDEAQAATAVAAAATDRHRRDPSNVATRAALDAANTRAATAQATATSLLGRLTAVESELAGAPTEAELADDIETATRLAEAATQAEELERAATTAAEHARDELEQARLAHNAAAQSLIAARERVARLEPPAVTGEQLATEWAALAEWADLNRQQLESERDELTARRDQTSAERDAVDQSIRDACVGVLDRDVDSTDIGELRELLASRSAQLRSAIDSFDQQLTQLNQQHERATALAEQAEVAEQLAYRLRSDQFEEWLMQSALGSLADASSVRLRELSGGQFSLELGDGSSFMVRDHSNADELRNAKTLSGGETFLASLSLALALADATTELAAEGAPPLESIFLDEGFGTLDAATLDTVAAAIEELGASGRMVGIITHIHELADRMPVRFEVTKAGGTATIERIET